ncbi:hypothetical protein L208DRAFT_1354764 [Tricholoma matsutake]|nr:hypothetical protein L208DRAFT_1354764 [Tricholoma matsutake 945]
MPITIEWASSFRKDGSRRRPPPSTMHGWLAKMRGTLLGDETLRSKGMQEMREASAVRMHRKARERQVQGSRTLFSFFGTHKKTSQPPVRRRTTRDAGRGNRGSRPSRAPARPSQSRKASAASGTSRRSTGGATRRGSSRPHAHATRRSGS